MGSLRHRLLRLEHAVAPVVETPINVPPFTNEERIERVAYWLSCDRDSLSPEDRQRVDGIRYLLERVRRRQESA